MGGVIPFQPGGVSIGLNRKVSFFNCFTRAADLLRIFCNGTDFGKNLIINDKIFLFQQIRIQFQKTLKNYSILMAY